jgi:uncharacterized membrane protein YvbJ
MLSKLLARLKKSPPKEMPMKVLSEENLQQLQDQLQLVNLTIKQLDEDRGRYFSEYGANNMAVIRSTLYGEKHLLEIKIDALANFLKG